MLAFLAPLSLALAVSGPVPVDPPTVLDPRLSMTLVASEPAVRTPVGIAVDARGRLFVLESNTHFRPKGYDGPASDRVLVFDDLAPDGRARRTSVFADGLRFGMNLAFTADGRLLVVERQRVLALEDRDGDGKADARTTLLTLETKEQFPHDGLGGLTVGRDGWIYVGFAENRGKPYVVRGTDGRSERGEAEGGSILRIRPDGSGLERFARGFWNPFGLAFYGRHLLAADNDPEVHPPDRLLDVVEGGDYGYRHRYGEAAEHPFQAWQGELPGTLGMIAPTGEAVCGVLPLTGTALPADLAGAVLVTSWADRKIDLVRLAAKGASLTGTGSPIVRGGNGFRPVAMAVAPDGAIYVTDWVVRSYPVHPHGRIWRLAPKTPTAMAGPVGAAAAAAIPPSPGRKRLEAVLALATSADAKAPLVAALSGGDAFLHAAAVTALARPTLAPLARELFAHANGRVRSGALLALRRQARGEAATLERALGDRDEDVRIAALIWAAEERTSLPHHAEALTRAMTIAPPSPQLVRVYRAAVALLGLEPDPRFAPPAREELLARLAPAAARGKGAASAREAIWALAPDAAPAALTAFEALALDRAAPEPVRADAIGALAMNGRVTAVVPLLSEPSRALRITVVRALRAGLAEAPVRKALTDALAAAKNGTDAGLREELRFAIGDETVAAEKRPETQAAWAAALAAAPGDADAGRRLFVHPGVGCLRCHRVGPLGADVGPQLTFIGNEEPGRLLESILAPSIDVVWGARNIVLKDGTSQVAMVKERRPDGTLVVANAAGQRVEIPRSELESDDPSDASLMPDGLQETVTVQGFRDLFAFLRMQRGAALAPLVRLRIDRSR